MSPKQSDEYAETMKEFEEEEVCNHDIVGSMWNEYCSKCGMKYGHKPTAEEDAEMLLGYGDKKNLKKVE